MAKSAIFGAQRASSVGGGYRRVAWTPILSEGPLGRALGMCTAGGGAVCPAPLVDSWLRKLRVFDC